MQLIKLHGLGNDFLLVEAAPPADGPALARRLCHRTRGVGADGLIFLEASRDGEVDATMTLFNADGSLAEISGNGIRCAAAVLAVRTGKLELVIDTAAGHRHLSVARGSSAIEFEISVDMGAVGPGPELPEQLPAIDGVTFGRIETATVGNPHVVVEVDNLDKVDIAVDGPALEAHWPGGINVHFLQLTGPNEVSLLHWERGSGVTEACGSGATVSATLAHRWGATGDDVRVNMPGGAAKVLVGEVSVLVGPATHVATVETIDG